MSDSTQLLELIEGHIVEHGGDFGGWTQHSGDTLQLFDGRVTLRAQVHDAEGSPAEGMVHAHVLTTLHEYEDEVLDACIVGMADDRAAALEQAAVIWMTGVAGPIKSFLDHRPVCMTCQAGVLGGDAEEGYVQGDFGLPGMRAYVGPAVSRGVDDVQIQAALNDTKPFFRFAAESAAPRRVHLAKATIISQGSKGWSRELEIDGHEVAYHDPDWPAGIQGPEFGYIIRFAVFELPDTAAELARRAELERAIQFFAEHFSTYGSVDLLMDEMVRRGFDPDLVHETESISTIAFGRTLFEPHGVQYSPTIIRARRDGQIQTDVQLMTIPAYTRARALAARLRETLPHDDFLALCTYNAESNAILKAMDSAGDDLDLTALKLYPSVVPDRDASEQTMDAALALLNELIEQARSPKAKSKSKWKFW